MNIWQSLAFLEEKENILHVDGVSILSLVEQYGTPTFIYSEARIRHNSRKLASVFQNSFANTHIFYASKANSNLAVLQIIKDTGLQVEVNSGGELYKALKAGFSADQIVYNGVAKTVQEIEAAIRAGVFCVNVDSIFELERILHAAQRTGHRANIALRMVPDIHADTHPGLETGTFESKFGISTSAFSDAYQTALRHPQHLNLIGIHMHIGAQLINPENYKKGVRKLLITAAKLHEQTGYAVSHLNIGGGFPVSFIKAGEEHLQNQIVSDPDHPLGDIYSILRADISLETMAEATVGQLNSPALLSEIERISPEFRHHLKEISIIVEPGTSIIADTAILVAKIQNIKNRTRLDNGQWLILDAGFNTLLDVMAYHWYFHTIAASKLGEPHTQPYRLGGPLCDSADVYHDSDGLGRLPDTRMLPEGMRPGDLLAFTDVGGYTLEQMCQYNGQPRASALLVRRNGSVQVIRRRESYEDLVSHDLPLTEL